MHVLLDANDDDPHWGLRICEQAKLGPGTVYPALDRLTVADWVSSTWEGEYSAPRPRRRLYQLTPEGRTAATAALQAKAAAKLHWRPAAAGGIA
ncbi:PadR family transcriptional regulator [Cryptosporangium phraense]|uniref:PadR family transcriptional regulator n=1 Tax=Cryptosporangium phraense TaxID=2593070 RepID=A0A545ARD6_9ACTN|nr:PadR family transcriptional regulator [Cryptosporangium phraense]